MSDRGINTKLLLVNISLVKYQATQDNTRLWRKMKMLLLRMELILSVWSNTARLYLLNSALTGLPSQMSCVFFAKIPRAEPGNVLCWRWQPDNNNNLPDKYKHKDLCPPANPRLSSPHCTVSPPFNPAVCPGQVINHKTAKEEREGIPGISWCGDWWCRRLNPLHCWPLTVSCLLSSNNTRHYLSLSLSLSHLVPGLRTNFL